MRKRSLLLAAVMLFAFAGSAFAHCCRSDGHVWRYGENGYYCDGGYGHGPNCRY